MPVSRPDTARDCPECGESLSPAHAGCPSCETDAKRHNRWRLFYGGVGTALTLSLVFAPVGIPMLLAADHHRRQASGSRDGPRLVDHMADVIRSHVDFGGSTRGEFTRGGRSISVTGLPPKL